MRSLILFLAGLMPAGLTLLAQSPPPPASDTAPVRISSTNMVQLNVDHEPAFGPADAPVTLVEFGDLQCPSCRAEAPVLRQLIPQFYANKVRVVFKDYPLESIHPWARAASIAGRCIFKQDPPAFWKFYDWDYENQDDITVENLKAKVLGWAAANKIAAAQLESCMDSKATDAEITRNVTEGKAAGVRGTPTVFVNGVKSPSTQLPGLQQMIEKELAKRGVK
jgi:protein-disulfide isomerase